MENKFVRGKVKWGEGETLQIFLWMHALQGNSRICLICHLKVMRKEWRFRRSDELCKQVKTLSEKLVYFIVVTRIDSALICSNIQVCDVMVEYNNSSTYSIWTPPFNNCKDFPRSLNGESIRASYLVYKFDKQIARCNNSPIKILSCLNSHMY